jgi:acyl dehydratase
MGRLLPPGHYRLSDVASGDRIVTASQEITVEMIDRFADLTGDRFVIHMDDEAARRMGFRGRVAHGLLILSLADGLKNQAAAQLDAVASLGWNWSFAAPVYAGDSIELTLDISSKRLTSNPDRGIVSIVGTLNNQDGETVQRGTNTLMVRA